MESLKDKRARLAEEARQEKDRRARFNKLKSSVRSDVTKSSFLAVKYTKELLEGSEKMMLDVCSKFGLVREEVLRAYNEVLDHHLEKQKL